MPQILFHYSSYSWKQFKSVWLSTIGNPTFRIFMTSLKEDFAKFLAKYRTWRCLFCKNLPSYKISWRISNVMFDILQEILESHLFLMSRKFETRVVNGTESSKLNLLTRIKRIVEQGLMHLFITSICSHFCNKANFEQYPFNPSNW